MSLTEDSPTIDSLLNSGCLGRHSVRQQEATLYQEAFQLLEELLGQLGRGERISMLSAERIATRIVTSLDEDKGLMMLATDRTPAYSLQQHSLNVAVIATRIGQSMKVSEDGLVRICLAGLLHDAGSLTNTERTEITHQPLYSEELLSGYPGFDWLPEVVGQVCERQSGKGYPRGLKGRDICLEGKILGAADVFEACIHHRAERPAMTGYQALEIMTDGDSFSDDLTKAIIGSFSVYPPNEFVVLNTGEIGRVIDINPDNPLRPVVALIFSADRVELTATRIIDLSKSSQLWISSAITPDELPQEETRIERDARSRAAKTPDTTEYRSGERQPRIEDSRNKVIAAMGWLRTFFTEA